MSADEILQNLFKAAGLITAIGALVGIWVSRRTGVKGDEREARKVEMEQKRDTVKDRDDLIDQMQEDLKGLREDRDKDRDRITEVERKLEATKDLYYDERDYNRILIDFIYKGGTPPPPDRPQPRRLMST